jgi:hypothetical protein
MRFRNWEDWEATQTPQAYAVPDCLQIKPG